MADIENNNNHNQHSNNYGATDDVYFDNGENGNQDSQTSKGLLNSYTRQAFIRKVYMILSTQLAITVFMCYLGIEVSAFNSFLLTSYSFVLLIICFVVSIIVVIALVCYQSVARKVPNNYILLLLFTLCESYIVTQICVFYSPKLVLMAAFLTLAMFLSLTAYAFTTKTDFTMSGGLLFVCCSMFCIAGIFMFFTNNNVAHIIYCSFGVILFSIYLIYDTQLLMDNKQQSYTIDDYVIASLQLYLDIINIFLYILEILGRTD